MFSSFMASIYCLGVHNILSMDSAQVGPVRSLSQSPLLFVVVFCQAGPGRALHIALKTDGASCAKIRLEMQKFVAMFMPLSVNISWECFLPT